MHQMRMVTLAAVAASLLSACGGDSQVYAMSAEAVKKGVLGKQSSYSMGSQTRFMKAVGSVGNRLTVELWNDVSWKQTCEVELEKVDEGNTRIIPSCSTGSGDGSDGFVEMEIDEHFRQLLTGTPIDADRIMMKQTASFATTLPRRQKEALEAELGQDSETFGPSESAADEGWAESSDDDADSDWGDSDWGAQ